ncbi:TPA: hypothetical protein PXM11_004064 [Yersinia enterocolitica]|uniref:hypothetical protein n=1 Tax=Yersinia enterocolitica TaxID=630 RepID=UPI0005DCA8CD|nr:hypothetical protein [Yersinia enterocolitica]CNG28859.1 Uncharacterised protein [Yersinia enterocolitica]HDL6968454.1 hypothetical protein [Yersinia enterocolitica]HDL6972762.1 hypothetical protein [Yersinia enterocolitica]HDL6976779.1 hypothetical protein [Yersinia enterocolitica]HDL6989262.1 hypothetical protein [Yersinia enterocolitica]
MIGFRLTDEMDKAFLHAGKEKGISKHEFAKQMALKGYESLSISSEKKIEANIKVSASTMNTLNNFVVMIVKQLNPQMSTDEAIILANEQVFSISKLQTEQIVKSLGLGD